jgi:aspartate aminotransferase-like enzyme
LDLGAYVEANSVPYSQSSNLLAALEVALTKYETPEDVYQTIERRAQTVRNVLATCGVDIQVTKENATPAIVTLTMPHAVSAIQLGDNLFMNGFNLHYESAYLRKRNWLQIACLNDVPDKELDRMLDVLSELLVEQQTRVY